MAKKDKTRFQKITTFVVWLMLILTVGGVVIGTLVQTGVIK